RLEIGDRDGHWAAEEAGQADFRTRMLVYRPKDPARFNGTVILNWNNVTAGGQQYLALQISQTQQENWGLFVMPVDVRITTGLTSTTVVVWNDALVQHFLRRGGAIGDVRFGVGVDDLQRPAEHAAAVGAS
ncbi:MAG: hypothetical protein HC869_21435, partial [Rhodospirillales bacterium]|nr:hypothetical protein [Rhodospirillales bacterium]